MNLEELVDTLRRDILHDRSDRVAGDDDHLWSTSTLIRYIDAAQRRFARRSLCIRDGSSPVTQFTTVPYQQNYQLDPSVIAVYSARSMGNGAWINGVYTPGAYNTATPPVFVPSGAVALYPDRADLGRSGHAARRNYDVVDNTQPFDVNSPSTLQPGKPLVYSTDETVGESSGSSGVVTLNLYPMPDSVNAGCVIQLRVARMPTARLTPQSLEVIPEIPEDYHLDMLDWAAYLALRIVDHEAGDPERAAEFSASFEQHVKDAKAELERKTFAPQPWGFGRNGFSYLGN